MEVEGNIKWCILCSNINWHGHGKRYNIYFLISWHNDKIESLETVTCHIYCILWYAIKTPQKQSNKNKVVGRNFLISIYLLFLLISSQGHLISLIHPRKRTLLFVRRLMIHFFTSRLAKQQNCFFSSSTLTSWCVSVDVDWPNCLFRP